jgi:SAM-dependent methyltransferase
MVGFLLILAGRGDFKPHTNLAGDREIERSWIILRLGAGKKSVLDVGSGGAGGLALASAMQGNKTLAVDLNPVNWPYSHPNLEFLQGNILDLDLSHKSIDLIICCSAVEHIGLTGRYDAQGENENGDLRAMSKMRKFLKKQGELLLTIPVGRDSICKQYHRVYGEKRLPLLVKEFQVKEEQYWAKTDSRKWQKVTKREALKVRPSEKIYALGLFVLHPMT